MKAIARSGFVMLALGLVSCQVIGFGEEASKTGDVPLVGTEWDLVSFEVIGGDTSDAGSAGILLVFKEDGQFGGRSYQRADGPHAANRYEGTYKLAAGDSLSIEILWTTEINEPARSKYMILLQAVRSAVAYEIKENALRIYYDDRRKALTFKAR